jgi:caa(3)-type oxidase subunit IV
MDVYFSSGLSDVCEDSLGGARTMDATQLAIEEHVAEQHRHHKKALFFWVWGVLLVLTAVEVYLTYQNMEPKRMLTILMGLSLIKAALIIGFFMHLKYEVSRMKWLTMCSVIGCLILMTIFFFPDAFRILSLGVR